MSDDDLTPLQRLWLLPEEVDGPWAARRRLAAALRQLIDRCARAETDAATLDAARAQVEAALALLPEGRTAAEAFADASYFSHPAVYIDRGALLGQSNPVAPPMNIRWERGREGGRSVCDLILGEAYVGAPGMVHGGMVAACFDQLLGHAVVMSGASALTGRLSVSFPRPTRLHTPLRWEGRVVSTDGRRIEVTGTCADADGVTAKAEATFIELGADRARSIIRAQGPSGS